jgi:5-methylcytosine-specific restriction endonuclease McrA
MPLSPPTFRPPYARSGPARPNARQRGYDAEWESLRAEVIAAEPWCQSCRSTERLNVDHIVPIREAPHRRLDRTNLRVLCQSCHSAHTRRSASGRG